MPGDLECVLGTDARARVLAEEICQRVGDVRCWMSIRGLIAWTPMGLPAFLFVITVVVFFHELGHFLVARFFGVKVDVFSVGFGPEIFGWTDKHGTRWKLSWLPVGGYVKFAGDADAASRPIREAAANMSAAEREGALHVQAGRPARRWLRPAGPFANFVLAIVLSDRHLHVHRPCASLPPVIGAVDAGQRRRSTPASSPATWSPRSTAPTINDFQQLPEIIPSAAASPWPSASSAAART